MLIDKTKDKVLAENTEEAKTTWERTRGLIGRNEIESGYAMIINDCKGIHTWMMSVSIDVVMLNEARIVTDIFRNVRPWRMIGTRKERKYVIEIKADSLPEWLEIGDVLNW